MTNSLTPHNRVAIVGTGFGGIATAIRLQQAGFQSSREFRQVLWPLRSARILGQVF